MHCLVYIISFYDLSLAPGVRASSASNSQVGNFAPNICQHTCAAPLLILFHIICLLYAKVLIIDYIMVAIGETQVHRASRSQKQEFHKPEFCHVCQGKLKEAESSSWTLADQSGSDEATPSKAVENRSWF